MAQRMHIAPVILTCSLLHHDTIRPSNNSTFERRISLMTKMSEGSVIKPRTPLGDVSARRRHQSGGTAKTKTDCEHPDTEDWL